MEAMCAGAAIIASDTAPVREVMRDGETGVLVDFFDANALLNQLIRVLTDPPLRARRHICARFVCRNNCAGWIRWPACRPNPAMSNAWPGFNALIPPVGTILPVEPVLNQ